jgi:hypothetical protein
MLSYRIIKVKDGKEFAEYRKGKWEERKFEELPKLIAKYVDKHPDSILAVSCVGSVWLLDDEMRYYKQLE